MSEPTNREVAVLNAALELGAAERPAYLDEACAGDAALRQQVEDLLCAHAAAEGFLETPPTGLGLTRNVRVTVPLTEKPGYKIGRYKLLQQIGEGGCGVVYMAEQEEPVRRRVALKVIKLGMDTKQVIARFEAERQALALMDHSNIAKVLDAGATETGRPYFVMELVRGIKITDFCDENKVPTEDRLKLFIQVCQALQHAHQKGVIHRDIKPSNILVTINDGVPVPKVIDFGIAKATQGRLTDQTLFTAFEQFIGTPAYMSPEQAVMTSLDIDTRSDIYSLGVLLYELLTGRTPFDQEELLAAGLDEMRRTIREKEPPRPSTVVERLSKLRVERGEAHGPQGSSTLNSQLKSLSTDLDWIAMKCLEKDRGRRYETANGLAADIQRHLDNEPVNARPPSNIYRLQKAIRRNKSVFTATAAIAIVLVIGVVMSTSEAIRATRAESEQSRLRQAAQQEKANEAKLLLKAEADEKKAETEATKSQQVTYFLRRMLLSAGPEVALGRDTALLRGILDRTAEQVNNYLTNQPEVQAELLNISGEVYEAIGERAKAEAAFRQALVIQRKVLGKDDPALADTLFGLAQVLAWDKPEESETWYRESLEIRRKVYGNESWIVAGCLNNMTTPLVEQGKFAEAESFGREALAMKRKLMPDNPDVAISLRDLALVLRARGKLDEAESLLREALASFRKSFGDVHPDVAFTLQGLADLLSKEGNLAGAEAAYREALAIQRKLYDSNSSNLANTLDGLKDVLQREGKLVEVQLLAREELASLRKQLGNGHVPMPESLNNHVSILLALPNDKEAEQFLGDLLKPTPDGQPQSAGVLQARTSFFARRGRWKEAAVELDKLVELDASDDYAQFRLTILFAEIGDVANYRAHCQKMVASFGTANNPGSLDRTARACLLVPEAGFDRETACQLADRAVTLGKDSIWIYYFQLVKGLAQYRAGHFASAVDWVGKSIGQPFTIGGPSPDWNRDAAAYSVLAMAQHQLKRSDEARAALAKGVDIVTTKLPKLENGDLGENWIDGLIAHILLREAQALIGDQPRTIRTETK